LEEDLYFLDIYSGMVRLLWRKLCLGGCKRGDSAFSE